MFVSDKIPPGMFLILCVVSLVIPLLILLFLDWVKPGIKYTWLITFLGVISSSIFVLLWQVDFPDRIILPPWQPVSLFQFQSSLLVDSTSWSYSLSLVALATAVILTGGMREERKSISWIITLLYTILGILAVSAGDPLTLVLVWTALDIVGLLMGLFLYPNQELGRPIITAFSLRLLGTGIFLFSSLAGSDLFLPMSYERVASGPIFLIFLASILRLGIFPLRLQYPDESSSRSGLFTNHRLVTAAAASAFLARIPGQSLSSAGNLGVFALFVVISYWAGWKWSSSSNEFDGRPYWILGISSLVAISVFITDPVVNPGIGVMLVISTGLFSLFSSWDRKLIWLPLISLWGLAALPFSPAAGTWVVRSGMSWLPVLFILPAQSLLLSGFIHHVLHPGGGLIALRERWTRILNGTALGLLFLIMILLGL